MSSSLLCFIWISETSQCGDEVSFHDCFCHNHDIQDKNGQIWLAHLSGNTRRMPGQCPVLVQVWNIINSSQLGTQLLHTTTHAFQYDSADKRNLWVKESAQMQAVWHVPSVSSRRIPSRERAASDSLTNVAINVNWAFCAAPQVRYENSSRSIFMRTHTSQSFAGYLTQRRIVWQIHGEASWTRLPHRDKHAPNVRCDN